MAHGALVDAGIGDAGDAALRRRHHEIGEPGETEQVALTVASNDQPDATLGVDAVVHRRGELLERPSVSYLEDPVGPSPLRLKQFGQGPGAGDGQAGDGVARQGGHGRQAV